MNKSPLWIMFALTSGSLTPVFAGGWDDLWQRQDQQAYGAFQQEQYDDSARLSTTAALRGLSEYRQGQVDQAIETLSGSPEANDLYNAGTMAAENNQLDQAAQLLKQSLDIDPDHQAAQNNLQWVKQRLQEQKQQDSQENKENEKSDQEQSKDQQSKQQKQKEESSSDSSDGENRDSEQSPDASDSEEADSQNQQSESNQESTDGEADENQDEAQTQEAQPQNESSDDNPSDAKQEARDARTQSDQTGEEMTDEQRQKLEQWLKRIPDDPSALLRNKLIIQHQREYGKQVTEGDAW